MTASPSGAAIGRARTFATLALALLGSLAAAPASPAQLFLAFGDSITAGVGDDQGRAEKGYPPRLRDLLIAAGQPGVEVENAGVGGENTAEGLSRIRPILHDTLAEVLLLMEGTNDIANDISPETTRFNLGRMAEAARESGLTVVHATVIPRIPSAKLDPQNIVTQRMVQGIRQLAGEQSRDLADPFEVFSTTPDVFSRYYAHSNADPVGHPNADGYDLLADIFFDVLRGVDSVPPVLGRSTPAHAAQGVSTTPTIELDVWDFGSDVDLANTELLLNGAVLPAQVVANGFPGGARITSQLLSPIGGLVRLRLRSRDTASPPNTVDREVARFLIAGTTFLAGDIDRDGRVDGRDLVELARRFGARASEPRYRASADLNDDGIIDGTDLARLASNFGRSIG